MDKAQYLLCRGQRAYIEEAPDGSFRYRWRLDDGREFMDEFRVNGSEKSAKMAEFLMREYPLRAHDLAPIYMLVYATSREVWHGIDAAILADKDILPAIHDIEFVVETV